MRTLSLLSQLVIGATISTHRWSAAPAGLLLPWIMTWQLLQALLIVQTLNRVACSQRAVRA